MTDIKYPIYVCILFLITLRSIICFDSEFVIILLMYESLCSIYNMYTIVTSINIIETNL